MEKQENKGIVPTKKTLKTLLNQDVLKQRFNEVLGKKAPAFISSIIAVCNDNKLLQKAEPMSVISAAMIAATLDLPINQNLGFAYIVPYAGKAQFQMGWKGFVQLAMRTGQYKTINCSIVYEGMLKKVDRIREIYVFDEESKISDKIIGYVSYFKTILGFEKTFYMTTEECEKHGQKYSKSYHSGNWKTNFDAMALKTVCKLSLSKWGILSTQIQKALESDQALIEDNKNKYVDNPNNSVGKPEVSMPQKIKTPDEKNAIDVPATDENEPEIAF
jgi:recombination protein RecT